MPDSYGPFDESLWAEAQWYRHMTPAMPSGVIGTPAGSATTGALGFASSGLTITPLAGDANVGGAGYSRTAPLGSVSATANANSTFSRRDRLVLRRSLATHSVALTVIQGTAASTPVAPAITRDATTFDLPLFSYLAPPNSGTALTGVVDERVWINGTVGPRTGALTVTSNASGDFTVTHNLGVTPSAVFLQSRFVGAFGAQELAVTAIDSTTFTARAFYNNDPQVSQSFPIYWRAEL